MTATAEPSAESENALPLAGATRKQVRGSTLLLAGRLLSLGVNFAVQILIVRYLTKADYGAFAYALSIVTLVQSVVVFGLDRAVTRFVPIYDERGEHAKAFGTLVMVVGSVLSLGLAAVLLVYGLEATLAGTLIKGGHAVSLILILIFLAPIQALDGLQTGFFAVFSRPRAIFFRRYVLAPSLRLTVVLLLVLGGAGVKFLAAGYVVAGAVGVAIYTFLLYREVHKLGVLEHWSFRTMEIPVREVLGFTIPLLTSDLLYAVINTSDAVLLGHYRGATAVGALRVVGPLAQMNTLVLASFTILFTPAAARLFARDDRKGLDETYWGTAAWMAIVTFPIFALTFSLATPLTTTLFGHRYHDSGAYLALLAVGYFFQCAVGNNGVTLKVIGLVWYIVWINLFAAALNLGLNFLLIPTYGALGAAIGTSSTLVLHNLLKQYGLRRGGLSLFKWRYARLYASIAGAAGSLLAVQVAASPNIAVGLVLAALGSVFVLSVNRDLLRIAETFPELLRFRPARALVGR